MFLNKSHKCLSLLGKSCSKWDFKTAFKKILLCLREEVGENKLDCIGSY